ncbi:MAG: hypothetical protein ACTSWQ_01510 [Candidatus Thorarchaeota archaeon]
MTLTHMVKSDQRRSFKRFLLFLIIISHLSLSVELVSANTAWSPSVDLSPVRVGGRHVDSWETEIGLHLDHIGDERSCGVWNVSGTYMKKEVEVRNESRSWEYTIRVAYYLNQTTTIERQYEPIEFLVGSDYHVDIDGSERHIRDFHVEVWPIETMGYGFTYLPDIEVLYDVNLIKNQDVSSQSLRRFAMREVGSSIISQGEFETGHYRQISINKLNPENEDDLAKINAISLSEVSEEVLYEDGVYENSVGSAILSDSQIEQRITMGSSARVITTRYSANNMEFYDDYWNNREFDTVDTGNVTIDVISASYAVNPVTIVELRIIIDEFIEYPTDQNPSEIYDGYWIGSEMQSDRVDSTIFLIVLGSAISSLLIGIAVRRATDELET